MSINAIEDFARQLGKTLNSAEWEALAFSEFMPIGVYVISVLSDVESAGETTRHVLIFNSTQSPFEQFVDALPRLVEQRGNEGSQQAAFLSGAELEDIVGIAEGEFFAGVGKVPGYLREDLREIVQYYYVYGVRPQFIHFDDRSRYNFESVAREAIELDLTIRQKNEWLGRLWNDAQQPWQVFFGVDGQPDFERIVDAAIRRLSNFHTDSDDSQAPVIELGRRSLDDLSMSELKIADADLYWEIRREVEAKSRTKDGQYRCARTQFTSRNRHDFEVDHIVPRAKGGKTSSDNLQLVHWRENRRKGND